MREVYVVLQNHISALSYPRLISRQSKRLDALKICPVVFKSYFTQRSKTLVLTLRVDNMEVLAIADAIILKYLELPSTLKKRVFGNGRFMLENGDHCHFLRPLSSKRLFREENRKTNWRYLKRIITKACSQPSADSEWKQWMENQQTGVVAGENMALLAQKYGDICDILGHGSFGAVFLSHKIQEWNPNIHRFYALKVFRREAQTTETAYQRRVESEFYISSSLQHQNIVRTFELLRIGNDSFCECLEYCSGGDLHSLVATSGQLEESEADCFFKQLMRGVNYIHEMGIAHRDLKPENLLLSSNGCLKISDFGSAECFRLGWENQVHMSRTRRGSRPFVSPEQYLCEEFDPRSVDIWAAAMTYLVMRTGRIPWKIATDQDESFRDYVADRIVGKGHFFMEEICNTANRRVIYSMLDIENMRRPIANEILDSRWLQETKTCTAAGSSPL